MHHAFSKPCSNGGGRMPDWGSPALHNLSAAAAVKHVGGTVFGGDEMWYSSKVDRKVYWANGIAMCFYHLDWWLDCTLGRTMTVLLRSFLENSETCQTNRLILFMASLNWMQGKPSSFWKSLMHKFTMVSCWWMCTPGRGHHFLIYIGTEISSQTVQNFPLSCQAGFGKIRAVGISWWACFNCGRSTFERDMQRALPNSN